MSASVGNVVGSFYQNSNKVLASIADGATNLVSFTVAGAKQGDVALCTWNGTPTAGIVIGTGWASADDTVLIPFTNNTGGAVDPADTFDFTILLFRKSGEEGVAT